MKKIYFLLVQLVVFSIGFTQHNQTQTSSTQPASWVKMMQDPHANFYEVQEAFNSYWNGRAIEKGKGYKVFKRWENYMKPRVYPTGEMTQVSQTYTNFLNWERDNPTLTDKSTTGTWTHIGPTGAPTNTGAGRLNFVRFDPSNSSIMYVGAPDGGLWKSTDSGASWTVLTDQLAVIGCTDIAIDPNNSQILYLATGDGDAGDCNSVGVLKSTNGGTTWSTTGLTFPVENGYLISKLLIHPTNSAILLAATNAGVYRTTNSGTSWTNESTAGLKDMEFKPGDPNTVYAAGDEFFKSTDNGASWTQITNGLPSINDVQRIAIAVTEANPNYVYLLVGSYPDQGLNGIYRSTNSGTSFSLRHGNSPNLLCGDSQGLDTGGQAFYDLAIAASPTNAEFVLIGGVNLWKSTTGGSSFTLNAHWWGDNAPYIHADQHDIIFLPGTSTYFAANDGGIFKTTNNGTSWTDLSSNLAIAQQYRISLSTSNANLLIAGHQDNGTVKYNGTSWSQIIGGDGMDGFIDRTNNNTIIASYQYGEHQKSTDGGNNFSAITSGLPSGQGSAEWVSTIRQDPTTVNTYYAGGRSNLYRSTNGGSSWSALGTPNGTNNILEFAIAPSNNQVIYSIKEDAVSKSTNGGTSWTNVSTGLPVSTVSPTYVTISNTDPNVVYVTFSGYTSASKVYKTTNGGTSWTNYSTGLPNIPCNTIVFHNGSSDQSVYVGTDVGVYYRDNTMSSWTMFSSGLPRVSVRDLEIYYATNRLRAGTFGRGTWDSDLYTVTTLPVADFTASTTVLLTGQSTTFTDLSTGSPTSRSWTFTGGTPSSSTATNPTISYNTAGTYAVTLTVTNGAGSDTETKTAYITVANPPAPVADFIGNPTVLTAGQAVAFTNMSTNSPTGYSWTFTGGTPSSSTATNPSVVYNTPGVYTVTLVATSANGSDTETKTNYITVNAPNLPVADFTSSHASICPLQGIQFTSTSTGNPTSYAWSFPGAVTTTSTDQNPIVYYGTAGTFSVTLTVTNADGSDVELKSGYVTVGNPTGQVLPFNEPFEANFEQFRYISDDSGLGYNWQLSAIDLGNTPTTDYSYTVNNFANTTVGSYAGVWFPGLDLTSYSSVSMTFDVAYARYNAQYSDTLEFMVSTDCGTTFTDVIYFKGGSDLATVADQTTEFVPNGASSWRQETIDLTPFTGLGNENVVIRLMNRAGYGNNIFVDNINIIGIQPNPPVASFTANTNEVCAGNSISYTSTSTNNPTSYSWTFAGGTPSTSTDPNPVVTYNTAGSYAVALTVTNNDGSDTQTNNGFVTINALPSVTITAGGSTTLCSSETVTLTSSSASNNNWSNSQTTQSITASNAGNYFVSVTDNNSCVGTSNIITVTTLTNPTITLGTKTNPTSCGLSSGSIQINGSSIGTLSWSGAQTGSLTNVSLPATIPNLAAGNYDITFSNGCSSNIINTSLNDPSGTIPTISLNGSATICQGQSVVLTSSSNTGNTWSTNATSQSITVSSSGTYSVVVVDGNNCTTASSSVTITVNNNPFVTLGTITDPTSCTSLTGIVEINGSGTGTISWTGASSGTSSNVTLPASISNFAEGTYSLTFSNGCSSNSLTATLNDPSPLQPTITTSGATTFCNGGSVTLTSSSSNGNSWSTGSSLQSIVVTAAGSYTVTAVDVNNCTATSNAIVVTVNSNPVISIGTTSDPTSCASATGSIQVNGSGNGLLSWTGTSDGSLNNTTLPHTIHNLTSGSYAITFTSSCVSNTLNVTLTDPNSPTAPAISASGNTTFCSGSDVVLSSDVSNGLTWSNGATDALISVTTSGTYFATVSQNGCTATSNSITVTVNPTPAITLGSTSSPTSCGSSTGSITINGSATGSVSWNGEVNGNSPTINLPYTITGLPAGSYAILFNNVCISNTISTSISDPGAPTAAVVSASASTNLCAGQSVTLTSNIANNIVWSTGATSQSITVNSSGTYSVTRTSAGCSSTSNTIQVNVNANPPTPTISASGNTSFCEGGSVTLTSSSPNNNDWSTNQTTPSITVSSSGSYSVIVTQNGCSTSSDPISISVIPVPSAPTIASSNGTSFCEGGSTVLTSSSSSANTWSTSENTTSITVSQSGVYSVFVTQGGCTSATTPITITVNNLPTVNMTAIADVCDDGGSFVLTQGSPIGGTYSGSGVSGSSFDPMIASIGANTVTYDFTDGNSCSNSAQTVVTVNHCSTIEEVSNSTYKIYPNPSNDKVFIQGVGISKLRMLDYFGRVVSEVASFNGYHEINISNFSAGLYYLVFTENGKEITEKIEILK